MKNIVGFGLSIVLLMGLYQNTAGQSVKSDVFTEDTIQRVVCFKFKPGTTPEAIQEHLKGLAALKDSIPYILSYQAGLTVQGEMKEKS